MAKYQNRLKEAREDHIRYIGKIWNLAGDVTRLNNGERSPGMDGFQIRCGRLGPLNANFQHFGLTDLDVEKIMLQHGMSYMKVFRRPNQDEIDELMRNNERLTLAAAGHQNDMLWLYGDYRKRPTNALDCREAIWQHEIKNCQGRLTPLILLSDVLNSDELGDQTKALIRDFCQLRAVPTNQVIIIPVRSDSPENGIWTNNRQPARLQEEESFTQEESPL